MFESFNKCLRCGVALVGKEVKQGYCAYCWEHSNTIKKNNQTPIKKEYPTTKDKQKD